MSIIYGLLEKISYHNKENDFVVAKLREKEKKELTTIVGNLSGINPGESLKRTGKWVQNKRFDLSLRLGPTEQNLLPSMRVCTFQL